MVDIASENGMQSAKVILEQQPHPVTIAYTDYDIQLHHVALIRKKVK